MAKVDITTAGHTIIIEDDSSSLDAICMKALELWHATRDPKLDRGYGTASMATETNSGGIWLPDFGTELGRRA